MDHLRGCRTLEIESWKIKLAKKKKNESRHEATQGGSREKERNLREHLLADGEKCCKPTDLFLKSSAVSANTSANTASTNVSDSTSSIINLTFAFLPSGWQVYNLLAGEV